MLAGGTLKLVVVEPDGPVLTAEVRECVIPGALGSFGVLPGHHPMLALLGTGLLTYRTESGPGVVALAGGFCEVGSDRVSVLAESAERAEEIDVARAERARTRAKEHLEQVYRTGSGEEITAVRETLLRAETRLKVAGHGAAAPAHGA